MYNTSLTQAPFHGTSFDIIEVYKCSEHHNYCKTAYQPLCRPKIKIGANCQTDILERDCPMCSGLNILNNNKKAKRLLMYKKRHENATIRDQNLRMDKGQHISDSYVTKDAEKDLSKIQLNSTKQVRNDDCDVKTKSQQSQASVGSKSRQSMSKLDNCDEAQKSIFDDRTGNRPSKARSSEQNTNAQNNFQQSSIEQEQQSSSIPNITYERSEPNYEERLVFTNREDCASQDSNERASTKEILESNSNNNQDSKNQDEVDPNLNNNQQIPNLKAKTKKIKFELSQVYSTKSTMKGHFDDNTDSKIVNKSPLNLENSKVRFYKAKKGNKRALNSNFKKRIRNNKTMIQPEIVASQPGVYYNPYYVKKPEDQKHVKNALSDQYSCTSFEYTNCDLAPNTAEGYARAQLKSQESSDDSGSNFTKIKTFTKMQFIKHNESARQIFNSSQRVSNRHGSMLNASPIREIDEIKAVKMARGTETRAQSRPKMHASKARLEAINKFRRGHTYKKRRNFNLYKLNESPDVCNKCHEYISIGTNSSKKRKFNPYKLVISPRIQEEILSTRFNKYSRNRYFSNPRSTNGSSSRSRIASRSTYKQNGPHYNEVQCKNDSRNRSIMRDFTTPMLQKVIERV